MNRAAAVGRSRLALTGAAFRRFLGAVCPDAQNAYIRAMQQAFPWLVIIAVGATLVVLIAGVVTMLRHGKVDARTSNKLMRYRVMFQLAAVLLIALAFIFGSR